MIVCLEGAEANGKSTLAQELKNWTITHNKNAAILHSAYDKTETAWTRHSRILDQALDLDGPNTLIILDRHYPSEYVYQKYFENGYTYNTYDDYDIELTMDIFRSIFFKNNIKMILCRAPITYVVKEFNKKVKNGIKKFDDVEPIYNLYNEIENWFDYIYNYKTQTYQDILNYLELKWLY